MDLPEKMEPSAARLRTALIAAGMRVTRQRAAVYDQLLRLDHPTAEQVYLQVRREVKSVSLATIYNALDVLVASGLVTRLLTANGSARFDARRDHHYHLRCLKTGTMIDLDTRFEPDLIAQLDPQLADDLSQRGFQVTGYHLEVVGYYGEPPANSSLDHPRP